MADKDPKFAGLAADPTLGIGLPAVRTLSDEYHDTRAEPLDSDRVPDPEPPGLVHKVIDRVRPHKDPDAG